MSDAVFIAVMISLLAVILVMLFVVIKKSRPKSKRESDVAGGVSLDDPLFSLTGEMTGKRNYHTGTLLINSNNRIKISIINTADGSEKVMYIFSELHIGRSPERFPHDPDAYRIENDQMISGVHCSLINYGGFLAIKDNNSKNHTFLNDAQVSELTYVNDMDHIRLGKTELIIHILS